MKHDDTITPAQKGLGDMTTSEFREAAHRIADLAADYLERLEAYDVLPKTAPGDTRKHLPERPPEDPEPLDLILSDYTLPAFDGMSALKIAQVKWPGIERSW